MSFLKNLGFELKSLELPILIAWEDDQVGAAEVLVTALANSRLPGLGYNAKAPGTRGGHAPNPNLELAMEHVFYWKSFLKQNLKMSIELRDEAVTDEKRDLRGRWPTLISNSMT
ncbi:hypothetical protein F4678DRAFT_485186 [Xylaria arbuscula]|nr:hypothetical protein F4678DRAFT_485186 [Xylaria arbuscula]